MKNYFTTSINKCNKCDAFYGYRNGDLTTSVILISNNSGEFRVKCMWCGNEGLPASTGDVAIENWNAENLDNTLVESNG